MRVSRQGPFTGIERYFRSEEVTVHLAPPRLYLRTPLGHALMLRVVGPQGRSVTELLNDEQRNNPGLPAGLIHVSAPEAEDCTLLLRLADAMPLLRGKD